MPELVRLDVDDGVGIVRLDRPPANAISLELSTQLVGALQEAGARNDVGALVLWGGPKLFAAGADIKEMAEDGPEAIRERVTMLGDACDLLEALPKVSIAAISGFALGGGFELSLACDLRYAAEDARVGQPEIQLGVIPGAGGTQRMTWLAGAGVARDLTYSGRQVEASEAKALRLVERVLPSDQVLEAAIKDARGFARGPRKAIAAAKEAIRGAIGSSGPVGISREKELFIALFGTGDQREGMRAFIEKRSPDFHSD
jgi:enoyl-CoA hydratase/carnithine racemase